MLDALVSNTRRSLKNAFVAELVDALVSNTSNFTVVSVRVRPEVRQKPGGLLSEQVRKHRKALSFIREGFTLYYN